MPLFFSTEWPYYARVLMKLDIDQRIGLDKGVKKNKKANNIFCPKYKFISNSDQYLIN